MDKSDKTDKQPDVKEVVEEIVEEIVEVLSPKSIWRHLKDARGKVLWSSPLIYAGAFFFVALDLYVTVYQAVCFRGNGIPRVRRQDYIVFDRGRLPYLNWIEKAGCIYCSYANGLLAYVSEITARTEQHFCPIKHHTELTHPHSRYDHFLPYGDGRNYEKRFNKVRKDFVDIKPAPGSRSKKS